MYKITLDFNKEYARGGILNKLEKMSFDIENLRQEMYKSIDKELYIISPESLIISQKLDELIINYNTIKKYT